MMKLYHYVIAGKLVGCKDDNETAGWKRAWRKHSQVGNVAAVVAWWLRTCEEHGIGALMAIIDIWKCFDVLAHDAIREAVLEKGGGQNWRRWCREKPRRQN